MQQKVVRRYRGSSGHAEINRKHRNQRDGIRNSQPAMCQEHSEKGPKVEESEAEDSCGRSPPLKRKHSKEILGEIVDDSEGALRPVEGDEIFAESTALRKAGILDYLSQLHVVEH